MPKPFDMNLQNYFIITTTYNTVLCHHANQRNLWK